MGCGGMGGCGGSSNAPKTSNHSTKKMPDWGMTKKPSTNSTQAARNAANGFGQPRVKMSFGRKR